MPDPGWFVGRSVPAAWGKLFVVFGDDSLDPPAGGLCVVVNGFCASAGAAPRMANARIRVFMTWVLPLFIGVGFTDPSQFADPTSLSHLPALLRDVSGPSSN